MVLVAFMPDLQSESETLITAAMVVIGLLIGDKDAIVNSSDTSEYEDYHVVDRSLALYKTSIDNERADFKGYVDLLDKGYLRKAYRRDIKSRIVPEHLIPEMIKRGYGDKKLHNGGLIFSQAATNMRNDGTNYYLMFADNYSVSRTQGEHYLAYQDQHHLMEVALDHYTYDNRYDEHLSAISGS